MAIRVTQNMMNSTMMRNYYNSMGQLDRYNEQLSSGKKISRPSQDPVVAVMGMSYRTQLNKNDQYLRNASQAQTWLDTADTAMNEVGNVLHRLNELVLQSASDTMSPSDRQAMESEVIELKNQLGEIANQTVNGRYIFAGTDTTKAPYDKNAGDYTSTNFSEFTVEVGQGIYIPINVNGQEIFNKSINGNTIFKLMDNIINDLHNGNSADGHLDEVSQHMDNVLKQRATLGARVNRMELVTERLESSGLNITKAMSENEDADMAAVITNLKTQENIHRAALGSGARIIQTTLLDFLR
ncbi:flagellar hook-associated protein FlgL [Brevibacillus massiliensis]|uniref:flagellar hook-associated protein FlgL n=1 Tax=Brevibacillus massiliensis TaxID=1118054 RepID=UPI00031995CC|nr:flagellar hook-associated protein FlgL [Brevibacillus massiliensis]